MLGVVLPAKQNNIGQHASLRTKIGLKPRIVGHAQYHRDVMLTANYTVQYEGYYMPEVWGEGRCLPSFLKRAKPSSSW